MKTCMTLKTDIIIAQRLPYSSLSVWKSGDHQTLCFSVPTCC